MKNKFFKHSIHSSGFTLIEVLVALFVGSIVMYSVFEVIASNKLSTSLFSDRFFARMVATNQLLLLKHSHQPIQTELKEGVVLMNSQDYEYKHYITLVKDNVFECQIRVRKKGLTDWIYEKKVFMLNNR